MAATTDLQKSADDLEQLNGLAFLAQSLGAGELGGGSSGPPIMNLSCLVDDWRALLRSLRSEYGSHLAIRVDGIGSAYMTCESPRSYLRALMHGRAMGAGELLDNGLVEETSTRGSLVHRA